MRSLPDGFRAIVIGASGAIGSAFVQQLEGDARCGGVVALHRGSTPPIDYDRIEGVEAAAAVLREQPPFDLIIVATGVLHTASFSPERRLADLALPSLEAIFRANTFGPAMVMRHFVPRLGRERSVMAVLSAKVGSTQDNRLGGWYGYRASKAALNMLLKTAAIETKRTNPAAVLVALHPGTVKSALSRPFRGDEIGQEPADATAAMLHALDALCPEDSGSFVAYDGQRLPW
jgi:NAD(P)-dependent dehydrogenase (short-subunit alcohol dehydrogenase family)